MSTQKLFISYSHEDEAWKDRLLKQLAFLPNPPMAWHDRNISGGDDWELRIREAMDHADVAILLVTAEFLGSEFIRKVEVPRMRERHRAGELCLYPIIVSDCAWICLDWLKSLQCRPKDGQPLDTFFEESTTRGNAQLATIAREIAGLLGEKTEVPSEPDNSLRARAELVKKSSGIAEPPTHLEAAIQSGLTDIAEMLIGLTARSRSTGLKLDDVMRVVSMAIGHGAGVYNHSDAGRVGCARIYHRAASGLLELMPESPTSPDSLPPRDVDLAADWLRRIVMATPLVRERGADELAWELRWAFDSLNAVPFCDEISDVLADLSLSGTERRSASVVIGEVRQRCQSIQQNHVGVYVLRHAAQVVLSQMAGCHPQDGSLIAMRDRLRAILSAHPRIVRANLAEVALILPQVLADVIQTLASAGNSPRRSWWQRLIDPRV